MKFRRGKYFEEAFNWLCCMDVNSEAEASDREMILSTIEEYEGIIEKAIVYMENSGLNGYDIERILGVKG